MANKSKDPNPINRDGYWYLVRRVPQNMVALVGRRTIVWSTGVAVWQDPRAVRAKALVRKFDQELQEHWHQLKLGAQTPGVREHRKNVEHAGALQVAYIPNGQLATQPLDELLQRFTLLVNRWGEQGLLDASPSAALRADVGAVLGGTSGAAEDDTAAGVMVSQMLVQYEEVRATKLARKSAGQRVKWRVRRQSALDLFVTIIGGDKPFKSLVRKDAQAYRKHWQQRVEKGEVRVNSANRNMRHVSGMYSALKDYHQLEGQNIFDRLRIPGNEDGKRKPYDAKFVQDYILKDGQFDDLNPEARRLVYLCVETGVRLSEGCALDRSTIKLDGPIPYINIVAVGRETKTPGSVRMIPLVGVALHAMRLQPDGFPRYRDNADAASALINKALDVRGLRPGGKDQTLYSLRHTIVDRLKAAGEPGHVQQDILGHVHMYGDGTTLEQKHEWLKRIAFKPPSSV